MGWLFQRQPIANPTHYLTEQFTCEDERNKLEVLDAARVNNTVYMAVRRTNKNDGKSYTIAAVILIRNNKRDGFGYKDMDETIGPNECDCPDRIMRLLTPIAELPNPSYAGEWRARVAARKQERMIAAAKRAQLRPGATLLLPEPVSFQGGVRADRFRVTAVIGRRYVLEPISHPGLHCRLRQSALAEATIVPAGAQEPPPPPAPSQLTS